MGNSNIHIKRKSDGTFENNVDCFALKEMDSPKKLNLCDEFKTLFEKYKHMQKELEVNSHEHFDEIKRQIVIKRVEHTEKIDEITTAMLKQTEEYEEFFQAKIKGAQCIDEGDKKSPHVDYKASVHHLQAQMDQLKFISSQIEKCTFKAQKVTASTFGTLNIKSLKRYLVSCSDNTIKIWRPESNVCLKTLSGHTDRVTCLDVSTNGQLISASNDRSIKVWNTEAGECINTLKGHQDEVVYLLALPKHRMVSGSFGEIKLWDMNNGECKKTLHGHMSWIRCLVALPNDHLASCSQDKEIIIWDLNAKTNECVKKLSGHSAKVFCLLLLKNNRLASGSEDKTIQIWNIEEGVCIKTLAGHTGSIWSLESTDIHDLISCSADKTIKIWDIDSGECVRTLSGHTGGIMCMRKYSNDVIFSGSSDSSIRIWNLKYGRCISKLKDNGTMLRSLIFI